MKRMILTTDSGKKFIVPLTKKFLLYLMNTPMREEDFIRILRWNRDADDPTYELKHTIVECTGVPSSLLTGETAEENIAQAKALLAYKREYQNGKLQLPTRHKEHKEWFDDKDEEIDLAIRFMTEMLEGI